jgi:uncharacterized Zn-binding protein involved in type VI secretion
MRDPASRAAVRRGDPTDHGGEVISALDLQVHGIPVAGEGCLTWCPKCKGTFKILPPLNAARRHKGRAIVYDGDLTECGAKLIATLRD